MSNNELPKKYAKHCDITYPIHTIPVKEWKALQPPIKLNQEHVHTWQSCHDDNPPGDTWLINLFANEYYYLKSKDKHVFYCDSCGMTVEHAVTEIQDNPVYECDECGWHEDKVLTDLLMGEGDDE